MSAGYVARLLSQGEGQERSLHVGIVMAAGGNMVFVRFVEVRGRKGFNHLAPLK